MSSEIDTIIHISDLHIRDSRSVEFVHVLSNFVARLTAYNSAKTVVIICGDIFDNKIKYSAEDIHLFNELISHVSDMKFEIVIIAGNHDVNLRMNTQNNILSSLLRDRRNVTFYDKSGVYKYRNLLISVLSRLDSMKPDELVELNGTAIDAHAVRVALIHEPVQESKFIGSTKSRITSKFLDAFDMVLMGDIHQHEFVRPNAAYSGALFQQTFGESATKGFIEWQVAARAGRFIEVPNNYAHLTVRVADNGAVRDDHKCAAATCTSVICGLDDARTPTNIRIISDKCTRDFINTARTELETRFARIVTVEIQGWDDKVAIPDKIVEQVWKSDCQEELIREYLTTPGCTLVEAHEVDSVVALHKKFTESTTHQPKTRSRWSLKYLSWANVRNYGPRTSYINFDQIDGTNNICGVIANNGAGKSSIVQALLYGLFNVGKKIKREGAADSYVRVVIERMGITYMIERDKTVGVLVMADGQKIAAGNPKNVYAETIEPIVGKYDDFVRTCILRQKGADDFLYLTPTNRKKFLEELFDITCFDEYRRIVSEHISAANGSITALEKTLPIRTVDAITEGIRLINEQCAERQARHTKITNDIKACNESIRVLQSSMKPVNVAVPDASKLAAIKLEHRKATDTLISKHKLGSAQEIAHLHDKLIEKRGSIRANMPVLAGLAVLSNAEEVFKSCSARLAALDAPMESEECIARRDLATADMRVARDVLIAALTEAGVSAALINAAPNSVTISAADLEVQVSAARMSLDTNTFQYTQLRERIILIAMASGSVTDDELATKLTSIMDSVGALEKECAKYCSVLGYATDVDVDIIMSGIAALQAHIRSNEASVRAISVDPEIAALTFDAVMAAQKVNDDRIDRICRSAHYEACTHTLSILTARKEALLVVERESLAQIRAVSNSVALLEEECARIKGIDQCRFAEEDSLCSSCEHNRKVLHELIARYRGLQDKIDVMRGADAELVTQNAAISRRVADTRRELSKVSEDIAMLMDLEQKRMRASDYTSHISVLELRKTTAHMKQRVSRLEEFMQKQLSRMRHKHGYVELRDLLKGFATARSARAMAERSLTQLTAAQHEVQISELRKLRSDIEHNEERILLMRNCRHAQMSLEHASKKAALADIDTDIDAIETHKKIDTYLKRVAAAREAIKSNEATSEEIRIIDAEVDAMTRRLNGETAHLNKLTLDRSTDTAVLNNIKSVRARIDELLSERCIYAAYKKCIDDKKGIPFQILKQVITKFNEDAEVVSNMMGMPIISISIGRVDKSKVDTLNIMMRTPSGLVDILNTSGGEQECAAIAIRTVLCREYPSALADFFIIDEGFASLDDAAIAKVQTYMHNIKSRFRMIFMIAHQDALKDHIYTRFHIGGTPDAARLTHGDEIAATHARPSLDPAGIDDAEYKKVARGRPRKKPTAAEIDPFVLTASKSIVATPTSAPVEHATVKAPKPAAAKSAVQWTCDTCKTTIRLSSRAAHLTSKKHINLAKISGGTST